MTWRIHVRPDVHPGCDLVVGVALHPYVGDPLQVRNRVTRIHGHVEPEGVCEIDELHVGKME